MFDRQRLIARLVKLLALGCSPNEHEAALARVVADRLMRDHSVTLQEVVAAGEDRYFELSMGTEGFAADWRLGLLGVAAHVCGVDVYVMEVGYRNRGVTLAGERHDVERARELYEDLLSTMRALERRASKKVQPGMSDVDLRAPAGEVCFRRRRGEAEQFLLEDVEIYGGGVCSDSFRRGVVWAMARACEARRDSPAPPPSTSPVAESSTLDVSRAPLVVRPALGPAESLPEVGRSDHSEPSADREGPGRYRGESGVDLAAAASEGWFHLGRIMASKFVSWEGDGVVLSYEESSQAKEGEDVKESQGREGTQG
jgi:hypothetical protein